MKKLSMIIAVMGMMISPMMQLQAQVLAEGDVVGIWINNEDSDTIKIYKDNNKFFGEIFELKIPNDSFGKPRLDIENPDPKLKKRPLKGLIFMTNYGFSKNGWYGGSFYDYTDGKIYNKCEMKFPDVNNLDSLMIGADTLGTPGPMHSKTTYWTKQK